MLDFPIPQIANYTYTFDELQIYGNAQLAVLTEPVSQGATLHFRHMIGDRTGTIHIGQNQIMDLARKEIDLPFNVHVYTDGYLGLAPITYIHDVNIFLSGTLAHLQTLTIHHNGHLWLYKDGHTNDLSVGNYDIENIHVKTDGFLHMLTNPVKDEGINFTTVSLVVDGGGTVEGTHVYVHAENITVDFGGMIHANGKGYRVSDGSSKTGSTIRRGRHGVINPGLGFTRGPSASGAGHGGSGGRGSGQYLFINILSGQSECPPSYLSSQRKTHRGCSD